MFRARVLAQGFTIAAIVAGGLYFGAERHKERELWKLKEEEKAEEKRQKWIRELEARDEEEKLLKARLDKRRERKLEKDRDAAAKGFRTAEAKRVEAEAEAAAAAETASGEDQKGAGSGWAMPGWLGGANAPESKSEEPSQPRSKPDSSNK